MGVLCKDRTQCTRTANTIDLKMTSEIEIIDNFLSEEDFNQIFNSVNSSTWPWRFSEGVSDSSENNVPNVFQLVYLFYDRWGQYQSGIDYIEPLINEINPLAFLRIKANLLVGSEKKLTFNYHVDVNNPETGNRLSNCRTSIYYLNTNNGKTIFENGEQIDSVANRFISFPSYMMHTGTTCTDQKKRLIINLNYVPYSDYESL